MAKSSQEKLSALFAGLCTLDIIQSVAHVPAANEKVTALHQTVAAGGPATNAAVTFRHLGGRATLVTGVGAHPLAEGIRADLHWTGVRLIDLAEGETASPPVSSIMVTAGSGERSVVSLNAVGRKLKPPAQLGALVDDSHTVLIDAHYPELALAAARAARAHARLCILDGGSWKAITADLLSAVDVAICSSDFHPPGTSTAPDALDYILDKGVKWAAITQGPKPILWASPGVRGEFPVPTVQVVDTLGAGDIFHGAFVYAISGVSSIDPATFASAIELAVKVAAYSSQSFGTRTWMESEVTHVLMR